MLVIVSTSFEGFIVTIMGTYGTLNWKYIIPNTTPCNRNMYK